MRNGFKLLILSLFLAGTVTYVGCDEPIDGGGDAPAGGETAPTDSATEGETSSTSADTDALTLVSLKVPNMT